MTMSITVSHPAASASAPVTAPAASATVGLADLLAEVGTTIEALPSDQLVPATLATLTAHLVDGAGSPLTFAPERTTPAIVSLRALGVLAARTAGTEVSFPAARAAKVRTLLADLAAA
jgi:hypothetical protein